MQQTQKYKLNLIEPSDPFLPDGLNANTQKVEDVLASTLGPMQARVDAFSANLGTHGKNLRVAWGTYTGTGEYGEAHPNSLTFDFVPVVVTVAFVEPVGTFSSGSMDPMYRGAHISAMGRLTWTGKTVSWYNGHAQTQKNEANYQYAYFVFGYDEDE